MSLHLLQKHSNTQTPVDQSIEDNLCTSQNDDISCGNQLIKSARKIFAIIPQLKQQEKHYDVDKLRSYLLSEFRTFQQEAKNAGYDPDSILISCYILSACLDETIIKTLWGKKANWNKQNLLQELQKENSADERFFVILEKICQLSEKYIDTIELMYICMSLGFEGKFKNKSHGKDRLQQVINYTYSVIRSQRGEFEKTLSPSITEENPVVKTKKQRVPLWSVMLLTAVILIGMYGTLDYLLNISTTQVNQQIENIIYSL